MTSEADSAKGVSVEVARHGFSSVCNMKLASMTCAAPPCKPVAAWFGHLHLVEQGQRNGSARFAFLLVNALTSDKYEALYDLRCPVIQSHVRQW